MSDPLDLDALRQRTEKYQYSRDAMVAEFANDVLWLLAREQEPDRRTWLKLRTWETIQSRHRAGDTAESLAVDYGVALEWVQFVLFPENDIDARYARASDRTHTMRARAEAAEQRVKKLD